MSTFDGGRIFVLVFSVPTTRERLPRLIKS